MNSDEIFDAVGELARLSGNAQADQLAKYTPVEPFQQVIKAALCPYTTYGVNSLVGWMPNRHGKSHFDSATYDLLWKLRRRELTGNAALEAIKNEMERLTAKSSALLERILKRDLRAGIGAKLINKIAPGTIGTFDCMLAHKYEPHRIKSWPVVVEPKFDGVRALFIFKDGAGKFYSRTGKEFLSLSGMARNFSDELKLNNTLFDFVLDGEIMDKSGVFNKIVGDVHRKGVELTEAVYHVFDGMSLTVFESELKGMKQPQRKAVIEELMKLRLPNNLLLEKIKMVEHRYCHTPDEIWDYYTEIRNIGGEGVIVKNTQGYYTRKRSHDWMKIKDKQTADLPIVGFQEGAGKFEGTLGALIVDFNGVKVNVGSGLDDATRHQIWLERDGLLGKLVEVEYHEITIDKSLRHPRFIRFRTDKNEVSYV